MEEEVEELAEPMARLNNQLSSSGDCDQVKPLPMQNLELKANLPSIFQPPELELKLFTKHL